MTEETKQFVQFTIDDQPVKVPKGTTVYNACKEMGITLPIFCYQDRMPPFGACRVCLVEVEKMPKLQTSCTLEATEGMVVRTQTDRAAKGRREILEFLLINHPLDCPICDRGGECPLQDQAMDYGPGESRFFEDKRRFIKPLPLGPVLMLDRERCVVCARCTRFGDIVAGDHALEFIDRGFKTEVGTPGGGPAESKFIGNTIMICPVGALTSQVYRFRARPWDNDSANSSCTLCPVGCSMILDSRDGEIMRTRSSENREINDIWLCDKGWFGYEFSSSLDRIMTPLIRKGARLEPTSWDEALEVIARKINEVKSAKKLAGWGGNPLTCEENFLFQKFIRECCQVNHLDHRIGTPIFDLSDEGFSPGMTIPIGKCPELKSAILLGVDLTEEFPLIWLRLKEAINKGAKVQFIGHYAPEIAPHLSKTVLHAPGQELETIKKLLPELKQPTEIFVGRQYLASPQRSEVLAALNGHTVHILEGQGNSMGARWAGVHPELSPFGKQLQNPGLNALQVLETGIKDGFDFLYVIGADPAKKYPAHIWDKFLAKLGFLVVQDLFLTDTAKSADVVLPALCYVEKSGHFLNISGKFQTLHPGKDLPDGVFSDGEILTLLAKKLNRELTIDERVIQAIQSGQIPIERHQLTKKNLISKTNGSLVATFAIELFDHGERMKRNTHLVKLAKEPRARLHPNNAQDFQLQNGDLVEISTNESSIQMKVLIEDTVAENTIVLPLGFDIPVRDLALNLLNGLNVKLQKVEF